MPPAQATDDTTSPLDYLNQASDEQLRGVLAHEIAHEDLGHPAQAQVVGAGVNIGVALLEQLVYPAAAR